MPRQPTNPITYLRELLKTLISDEDFQALIRTRSHRLPIEKLLFAARLAVTFGGTEKAVGVTAPMTVTAIQVPLVGDRQRLAEFSEFILAGMSDVCDVDLISSTALVYAPTSTGTERQRGLEQFKRNFEEGIAMGKSVIALVSNTDELPDAGQALARAEYALAPISGVIIAEVMRAIELTPSRRLAERLISAEGDIAHLPSSIIVGALRQDEPKTAVRVILDAVSALSSRRSGQRLEDLYLPDCLRHHLDGVLADISDYQTGRLDGQDVSASTLLWGPPGCGKTSVARGIATSGHLHFVSASFSECQAAGGLSEYYKAMDRRVDEAMARRPSLFFIDELDCYVSRTAGSDRNDIYMMLVVNHMLEVLSKLNLTPGVFVLAATNHPSKIDDALLRAGRFDKHVFIGPPDRNGIEMILRQRLGAAAGPMDLAAIARQMIGLSGAEISTLASKALSLARRQGRPLSGEDLDLVISEVVPAPFVEQSWRIAVHEAGHAVVRASLGLARPTRVVLSAQTSFTASEPPAILRWSEYHRLMAVCLAGRAAEALVFGDTSAGAEADIAQATEYALAAETRLGFGSGPPLCEHYRGDRPEAWPRSLRTTLRGRMAAAEDLANRAVSFNEAVIVSVARALHAERELTADKLTELLQPVKFFEPPRAAHPDPDAVAVSST